MTSYGNGTTAAVGDLSLGDNYSYNWINQNYEAYITNLVKVGQLQQGNAVYLSPTDPLDLKSTKVFSGDEWIQPNSVWDEESGAWVKYDKVYDGNNWV